MKITQLNSTISPFGIVLLVGCLVLGIATAALLRSPWPLSFFLPAGFYLLLAARVADQWERVAVLRLGRFQGMRGPGMFWIIPVIDTVSTAVDQRVRVGNVKAESTLTRDTVPVAVDAVYFWVVWNAEKAILEVEDFSEAIAMAAQTALRESIGRHELAQMITERESIGVELQRTLDEKTNLWGITIQSVEVRDVQIPQPWKTPCPAKHKPNVNAAPASSSARPKPKPPKNSSPPPRSTTATPRPSTSAR